MTRLTHMLCTPGDPSKLSEYPAEEWVAQVKYDGIRVTVILDEQSNVVIYTRSGKRIEYLFPEFWNLQGRMTFPGITCATFDGEIVCPTPEFPGGDFEALQTRLSLADYTAITTRSTITPCSLVLFDIIESNGTNYSRSSFEGRSKLLDSMVSSDQRIQTASPAQFASPAQAWETAKTNHLEGIVVKRRSSPYTQSFSRSPDWVKFKIKNRQEFVVAGRMAMSLLIGYYDKGQFKYAGRVSAGLTQDERAWYREAMGRSILVNPFTDFLPGRGDSVITWCEPKLVCEVEFMEWTKQNRLRSPRYVGRREDKNPLDVVREV